MFIHDFYIILGVDKTNGTRLIKIGNARKFETRLSQYPAQYPAFVPIAKFPIRYLLSNNSQIKTYEDQMKDICKNHRMQRYDINHNGRLDNEFFVLNKTRESNVRTIVNLLCMFYTEADVNDLQLQAETFYNKAFGD